MHIKGHVKLNIATLIASSLISFGTQADTTEVISETTKSIIQFGKNFAKGLNDDVDEGRAGAEGQDGAVTVTNIEQLEKYVVVNVIKATKINGRIVVEVGFKNTSDKSVRIANLDDKGVVLLIDQDGYAETLLWSSRRNADITVPSNTGIKHPFEFNGALSAAHQIRFWEKSYDLSQVKIFPEPTTSSSEQNQKQGDIEKPTTI